MSQFGGTGSPSGPASRAWKLGFPWALPCAFVRERLSHCPRGLLGGRLLFVEIRFLKNRAKFPKDAHEIMSFSVCLNDSFGTTNRTTSSGSEYDSCMDNTTKGTLPIVPMYLYVEGCSKHIYICMYDILKIDSLIDCLWLYFNKTENIQSGERDGTRSRELLNICPS